RPSALQKLDHGLSSASKADLRAMPRPGAVYFFFAIHGSWPWTVAELTIGSGLPVALAGAFQKNVAHTILASTTPPTRNRIALIAAPARYGRRCTPPPRRASASG